ncbi:hypothetical protein [Micrococcus sp.]|uniref:hypothetical protein n=1 Tax=Micrococcus sp. TaxID=1271 RepID=UPI002A91115A|nr:hypothetical protein [Micrococcus sp.]MDY6055905.1 hypothetical protein [Micrococcus sp.]
MPSTTPGPTGPARPARPTPPTGSAGPGRRGRLSAPVLIVVAALALQAAAMLWLGVDALRRLGTGVLGVGATVTLALVHLVIGAGIAVAAVALARGRAWSRGAGVAVQLFGVLLSTWLMSLGDRVLGTALLVVSGAALICLFSRAVAAHLGAPARG